MREQDQSFHVSTSKLDNDKVGEKDGQGCPRSYKYDRGMQPIHDPASRPAL